MRGWDGSIVAGSGGWLARLLKREPLRADSDWERRLYPCARWFCFSRSPAYIAFERLGKSWCWRHYPKGAYDE